MRIATTELDKEELLKDFGYYYRTNHLENEFGEINPYLDIISKLVDQADSDMVDFLKSVDSIEQNLIQRCCRKAAIVQMYNVGLSYRKSCRSFYIAYCNDDILVIQHDNGYSRDDYSVFVSKYGEIKIGEGRIWINEKGNYGYGWSAREIVDGTVSERVGFYSNAGEVVLPCGLFQSILPSYFSCPVKYESLIFNLCVYGNEVVLDDKIKAEAKMYRDDLFISPERVVFSLKRLSDNDYDSVVDSTLADVPAGVTVSREYAIHRGLVDPSKMIPSKQESVEKLECAMKKFRVSRYTL